MLYNMFLSLHRSKKNATFATVNLKTIFFTLIKLIPIEDVKREH